MDEMTNARRVEIAEALVRHYRSIVGSDDDLKTSAVDLLSDLRHLANSRNWDWAEMDSISAMHFHDEVHDEQARPPFIS